jgi:hypothetical protein
MINFKFIFISIFFCVGTTLAQNDSLEVFRSSNSSILSKLAKNKHKNSFSFSLNHLGRGGPLLVYERIFIEKDMAIYLGGGFSYKDYVGQFTLDDEASLFRQEDYSSEVIESIGKMIDFGLKFNDITLWENAYFAIGFTHLSNNLIRKIDSKYLVADNGPVKYNLDYLSNEIKLILGITNEYTHRFYLDGYIGSGLRFIRLQKLNITDDPFVYFGLQQSNGKTEIEVRKVNEIMIKPWLFFGFKFGIRF